MSTTTLTAAGTPARPAAGSTSAARPGRTITPIPTTRLMKVELRKMFDTRAGFWLMASVGILSVLATAATILWAPDEAIDQETFATAIGFPLSVILPIIALLSITSEYSQRTGLTTYTLVPWRGRVVLAKVVLAVAIGVVSMFLALAIGAGGNLLGASIAGIDPVWDVSAAMFAKIVLANVIGMLVGFMLGVLMRSSAAAIVGYFVFSLVLPGALATLAAFQEWFRDLQPWVDVNYAIGNLFADSVSAEGWQQLGVTTLVWVWIPLAIGLRAVLRAEVK